MSWNWVDVLVILLLVRWAYVGHTTLFAAELAKLCAIFVTYYFTLRYYDDVAVWITSHSRMPIDWSVVVAFALIAVASLFIVRYTLKFLAKVATVQFSAALGQIGGFLTGAVRGLVVTALLLYGFFLIPDTYVKTQIYKNSWWGKRSIDATPVYYKKVTGFFFKDDASSQAVTKKYMKEKRRLTKKKQPSRAASTKTRPKTKKQEKVSIGQRVSESFQDWWASVKDKFKDSETQDSEAQEMDSELTEETIEQIDQQVDEGDSGLDRGVEALPRSELLKANAWE